MRAQYAENVRRAQGNYRTGGGVHSCVCSVPEVNKKQCIDEAEQSVRERLQVRQKMRKGRKREYSRNREMGVHRSPQDTAPCSILHSNAGRGGGFEVEGGGNYKLGCGLFR
jgi:hypothetical protein